MSLIQQFKYQVSALDNAGIEEITPRLKALAKWMDLQPVIKAILDALRANGRGSNLLENAGDRPPAAGSHEEIAAVGLALIDRCNPDRAELWRLCLDAGIVGNNSDDVPSSSVHAAIERYLNPFFTFVGRKLPAEPDKATSVQSVSIPVAIQESIQHFQKDHPDPNKVAFIMMQFGKTSAHENIEKAVKTALLKHGITGLLARDREYHDSVYPNIQTYLHGCRFGIAVFDRIEEDAFNPNVSLEVGYLLGLKKPVLLLKDATLHGLQTDLVGHLYRPFDPQHAQETIGPQVEHWMEDKHLI